MMEAVEWQPEMEQQTGELQQELKTAKEERSRALQELKEVKKTMLSQRNMIEDLTRNKASVEMLEVEVERAKESERKMLDSLVSQTKQLEQTKISLEESKLEIRSLRKSTKAMETWAFLNARNTGKHGKLDTVPAREEISYLRNELKAALEAEEKSKKAMDDLALALKEVTTESKLAKEKLSKTQIDLANAKAEVERSKASLKITEDKLRMAAEETNRLKAEAEEAFTAWMEKENGFLDCMKMCEDEIANGRKENSRLIDSQKAAREEVSKLRDIVKHAVNESTVVKEALEIARNENSQLKDMLSEKDKALKMIKQKYECLKVTEAAALNSVNELKSLLVATSSFDSISTANSFDAASFGQPKAGRHKDKVSKTMEKFPSEHWRCGNPRVPKIRRFSLGEPQEFRESIFDGGDSLKPEKEHKLALALDAKGTSSSVDSEDRRTVILNDFDHMDVKRLDDGQHERESPTRLKRRRQILRRFGDLLKRGFAHA